jgi:hypothetical protein
MKLLLPIAAICLTGLVTSAYETNALPRTRLQAIETRTNTVIVRGIAQIGSVEGCGVLVTARESTDKTTREKALGVAVTLRGIVNVIDHDELDSMVKALDQLGSPQWGDTSLPQVEVIYTTKDGLRIASFSNKGANGLEAVIQTTYPTATTTVLNATQLVVFRNLIDQARGALDAIGRPKP